MRTTCLPSCSKSCPDSRAGGPDAVGTCPTSALRPGSPLAPPGCAAVGGPSQQSPQTDPVLRLPVGQVPSLPSSCGGVISPSGPPYRVESSSILPTRKLRPKWAIELPKMARPEQEFGPSLGFSKWTPRPPVPVSGVGILNRPIRDFYADLREQCLPVAGQFPQLLGQDFSGALGCWGRAP